ncbi:MAG: bifunctional 3-(3-hydroxy-phenyl)propionate/3-hydroxycinnamic acid hydroxylase [Pseudomonadota bacterium]
MTTPAYRCDVAVVGCGPTGAVLAKLLALSGVSVVVLDRAADLYPLPRAVHFDDECMRVFQTVGISDALRERVRVNPGMRFVAPDGRCLLDWPRPAEITPQGWHASYRLHQPDLEQLLRATLDRDPAVDLLTAHRVDGLVSSDDGVVLHAVDEATGTPTRVAARYAVGCDGARSTVRSALGLEYTDLGFTERWLVIDLLLTRERPDLGDHTLQFCNPEQPATYCRNPGTRRRWEFRLNTDDDEATETETARIWARLAPWLAPHEAEIERRAVYTFRSAVTKAWRRGRVLLAGDAAHLTPPFMGQGMCAGIRDAANLAWKVASCMENGDDPAHLDSYAAERGPHVRAYIDTAARLGNLVSTVDPTQAQTLATAGTATMASLSRRLGGVSAEAHDRVGTLAPQPTLADGIRLDDAVGYRHALLTRHRLVDATTPAGVVPFDGETHPGVAACLDALGVDTLSVRPDRYIDAVYWGGPD